MNATKNVLVVFALGGTIGCGGLWGGYLQPLGEATAEECGRYTCTKKGGTSAWCYENTKDKSWYECTAGSCPDGAVETMCAAVMADGGTNDGGNTIPDLDTTPTYNIGDKRTGAGPVKGKNGETLVCVPYDNQPGVLMLMPPTFAPDLSQTQCEVMAPDNLIANHVYIVLPATAMDINQNYSATINNGLPISRQLGWWYRAPINTTRLFTNSTKPNTGGKYYPFEISWLTANSSTFGLNPPQIITCKATTTPGECLLQ